MRGIAKKRHLFMHMNEINTLKLYIDTDKNSFFVIFQSIQCHLVDQIKYFCFETIKYRQLSF